MVIEVQEARSRCFSLGQNLLRLLHVLQRERERERKEDREGEREKERGEQPRERGTNRNTPQVRKNAVHPIHF